MRATVRPPRRRKVLAGAASLVVVAAAVTVAVIDPFAGSGRPAATVAANATPTSLATVREGPLASQVNQTGTLGYTAQPDGSPYSVINHATGTYTALPAAGRVVTCGQVLYRVADKPTILLCGQTPAYRSLAQGDSGPDVRELNRNLVRVGYAARSALDPTSDYFSAETASALQQLQANLGVDQTGTLDIDQAVFLPGPLRISKVTATLGTTAAPATQAAQATTTARQVEVNLDAAQQAGLKVGDRALVTLPGNQTTPGVVTRIGSVASSSGSGSSTTTTIPIYITLQRPRDAGSLDQAPVQVQITTAGVARALTVPVDALVAMSGGGYAVERVDARGAHHLVPVAVGLFDDADGLVQVSGSLAAGDRVVVPST